MATVAVFDIIRQVAFLLEAMLLVVGYVLRRDRSQGINRRSGQASPVDFVSSV